MTTEQMDENDRFDEVPQMKGPDRITTPAVLVEVREILDAALRDPEVHPESVIRALYVAGIAFERYGQVPKSEQVADAMTTRGLRMPDTLASYRGAPIAAYNLGWQEARETMRRNGWREDADWGPIPRYAMLDIWMAIYGADTSQEFEAFADEHGYADTWSRLCAIVREHWTDETTMASEPVEDRLRRAWLNGYTQGFREGMERAAYIGQEWDHR